MADSIERAILGVSATLLLTAVTVAVPVRGQSQAAPAQGAPAQPGPAGAQVNTLREVFERLFTCWKPPSAAAATPMDITVMVSFNRSGAIMGRPRITYESPKATDRDRLAYRVAVMEALQRCAPMPFTEAMAGAVAGRPLTVEFRNHLKTQEKKAWLSPKIL